jgi:hypothetical protein
MLRIKLDGGLGNQLFQYAFLKAAARKIGTDFQLDISAYNELPSRAALKLQHLNLPTDIFYRGKSMFHKINLLRLLRSLGIRKLGNIIVQHGIEYFQSNGIKPNSYFYGYFQHHKYFDFLLDELVSELTYTAELSKYTYQIEHSNSICIHVRRGDYIDKRGAANLMATISENYYLNAINHILKSGVSSPVFFLFSNDLSWSQDHLVSRVKHFGECILVDHSGSMNADLLDFECMKRSKHQVIANSTFSWWAAYLNQSSEKIVIAPKYWYKKTQLQQNDFYPSDWRLMLN